MTKPESARPCATCPFLRVNCGKPNPDGWEAAPERDGFDRHDWYSPKNLRRVWDGIRRDGATLQCHCTVDDHAPYVGKTAKAGRVRLCAGSIWLASRHVSAFGEILRAADAAGKKIRPAVSMGLYRSLAGRFPMTRAGIVAQTVNLTMPPMFGGLPPGLVPSSFHPSISESVGVPWPDPLANDPHDSDRLAVEIADLVSVLP